METIIIRDYLRRRTPPTDGSKAVSRHRKTVTIEAGSLSLTICAFQITLQGGQEFADNTYLHTKQANLPSVCYYWQSKPTCSLRSKE